MGSKQKSSSDIIVKIPVNNLPRQAFLLFLTIEICLVLLDYVVNVRDLVGQGPARRFANIAREDGVGTWFASTQLLFLSLTAFSISFTPLSSWSRRGWLLVALFFLFMSADETAMIHERVGSITKNWVESLEDFMSYSWHIAIGPFFILAGIAFFYFLWKELSEKRQRLLVFLGLCSLATAMGLDFVEGMETFAPYLENYLPFSGKDIDHSLRVTEEVLEMFGNSLFLYVLLQKLQTQSKLK